MTRRRSPPTGSHRSATGGGLRNSRHWIAPTHGLHFRPKRLDCWHVIRTSQRPDDPLRDCRHVLLAHSARGAGWSAEAQPAGAQRRMCDRTPTGLKTPLVEKGPVPRRATPAANGIGVAVPALAGMPDRIKVEPVTGSCRPRPCHGRLMPKRPLGCGRIPRPGSCPDARVASPYPLDTEGPHKSRSVARGWRLSISVCRPFRLAVLSGSAVVIWTPFVGPRGVEFKV